MQGSGDFVEHPSVPLESIVADVNLDGIGWSSPNSQIERMKSSEELAVREMCSAPPGRAICTGEASPRASAAAATAQAPVPQAWVRPAPRS